MNYVHELDAQSTENLLFFLQNAGQIRNGPLVARIMKNIEEKEWVLNGEILDIMILVNLLNEHKKFFQPEKLWNQIEKVACQQCFSQDSKNRAPTQSLREIACLYAFEFSRSHGEFNEFYKRYFRYMEENKSMLAEDLSLMAIAHAAIAYASFGMTTSDHAELWRLVRKGTAKQLLQNKEPLPSAMPIEMILGALTVVDGTGDGEK